MVGILVTEKIRYVPDMYFEFLPGLCINKYDYYMNANIDTLL